MTPRLEGLAEIMTVLYCQFGLGAFAQAHFKCSSITKGPKFVCYIYVCKADMAYVSDLIVYIVKLSVADRLENHR